MRILGSFDKASGQMTIEKQYRLFNKKVATHQTLSDIQQAQMHKSAISDRTPVYLVNLELTSAKPIALSPPMRDRQQCEAIVNSINQFLKS
jgi:hypothetical protein